MGKEGMLIVIAYLIKKSWTRQGRCKVEVGKGVLRRVKETNKDVPKKFFFYVWAEFFF
jgi:hypothetical protein